MCETFWNLEIGCSKNEWHTNMGTRASECSFRSSVHGLENLHIPCAGSPTLGGHMPTQVQVALGAIIREREAKQLPCGVFGSFGWSGEAVRGDEGQRPQLVPVWHTCEVASLEPLRPWDP